MAIPVNLDVEVPLPTPNLLLTHFGHPLKINSLQQLHDLRAAAYRAGLEAAAKIADEWGEMSVAETIRALKDQV